MRQTVAQFVRGNIGGRNLSWWVVSAAPYLPAIGLKSRPRPSLGRAGDVFLIGFRVADEAKRRNLRATAPLQRRTSSKSRVGMNPCASTTGTPATWKRRAKMAAKEAVSEKFQSLGMNISTRFPPKDNSPPAKSSLSGALRPQRHHSSVIGALVSAGVWASWTGFKANAAPPVVAAPAR